MTRRRADRERITIQDVAERAGVSKMTVSNVVNRTGKVGAATRRRVLEVIEELGYVPSQAARHLVGSAAARIGLLYRDVESMFLNVAVADISVAAAERGLQLLIRRAADSSPEETERVTRSLKRSGADGLLLIPPYPEVLSGSALRRELGMPMVAIATAQPFPDIATVRIDNFAAARAMAELLISRGYRRIAFVTGPTRHSDSQARLEGYKAALAAHGLTFEPRLCVEGLFTFSSGIEAANRLFALTPRPDAVMAANDDMATAILWVAHSLDFRLPEDLAVTGFDDTLVATRVWPTLTTIRQPLAAMAGHAIDILVEALRQPAPAAPPDRVLDFALVERGSIRSGREKP
ncbi:MAG TPA: LacI family DNA-binding transcriptional regulator [Magnetospirillaceae bacterium]|nr:LacI family DNA-binding transcriptional regulator [Magnetospirillaceae bacterium]